jgi:hypothetical protein
MHSYTMAVYVVILDFSLKPTFVKVFAHKECASPASPPGSSQATVGYVSRTAAWDELAYKVRMRLRAKG